MGVRWGCRPATEAIARVGCGLVGFDGAVVRCCVACNAMKGIMTIVVAEVSFDGQAGASRGVVVGNLSTNERFEDLCDGG